MNATSARSKLRHVLPAVCLATALLGRSVDSAVAEAQTASVPLEHRATADLSFEPVVLPDLPHGSVGAILQDRAGYIWIGALDGLSRYDGRALVTYRHDPAEPASLSSNAIWRLLEDRSGALWVATWTGIDRFDRRTESFAHYPLQRSPAGPPTEVLSLFEDSSGALWLGIGGGLLRRQRDDDRFVAVDAEERFVDRRVRTIQETPGGDLWVLTTSADDSGAVLHLRQGQEWIDYPAPARWDLVTGFLIDTRGRFWINISGLGAFDPATGSFSGPLMEVAYTPLSDPYEDGGNDIWTTSYGGTWRFTPETGQTLGFLASDDPFLGNIVTAFTEDASGALWVGTRSGIHRSDPSRKLFEVLRHDPADPSTLSADPVSALAEDSSGDLWIGTYGGGLNRLAPSGEIVRHRHRPQDPLSLCHDVIWHLAAGRRQAELWIGGEDGLCRYDLKRQRFTRQALPTDASPQRRVTFITEGSGADLWVSTLDGLVHLAPGSGEATVYRPTGDDQGPSLLGAHSLLLDEEADALWIGSVAGLERLVLSKGRFEVTALPDMGEGVFDIHRAGEALWLATGGGLLRLDPISGDVERYTTADGLPGSSVYSVLEGEHGRLWLGSNRGLTRFDRRSESSPFRNFDPADGIAGTEMNRHAALRLQDGRFAFGGIDGMTVFSPETIRDNPFVPPIVLTRITTWSKDGPRLHNPENLDRLTLSYRESTLALDFAALSFTDPHKNRYAYRLEGHDQDWVDSGTRAYARYTQVPPGSYVFRVRGSNNDGVWNSNGLAFPVVVTPPFWQTWWFRVVSVAVLAALAFAAHRYRVSRLLEMERVRLRIASDLHDDFSSDLAGIALAADLLHRDPMEASGGGGRLLNIRDSARRMVHDMRDVVWYVNPEHDSLEATVLRMRQVAATLLGDREHSFAVDLEGAPRRLRMILRRNLLLIFKEAVHNVARHSEATSVTIGLTATSAKLTLIVGDNGRGFDPGEAALGDGLSNIRRRSREIGAKLEITSAAGKGAELRLTADLASSRDRPGRRGSIV